MTKGLLRSCEILFDRNPERIGMFLRDPRPEILKAAYRRCAMETHPDRFAGRIDSGAASTAVGVSFQAVREAYEHLSRYLEERTPPPAASFAAAGSRSAPSGSRPPQETFGSGAAAGYGNLDVRNIGPIIVRDDGPNVRIFPNTERLHRGPVPDRPLLFGHFLYYCGLTNWRTIARVLIWQRMGRPKVGEIGRGLGIFNDRDIGLILRSKARFQLFGEAALQLRMITDRQLKILVERQRSRQKKFGAILLEKDLLREIDLRKLLYLFNMHNKSLGKEQERDEKYSGYRRQ